MHQPKADPAKVTAAWEAGLLAWKLDSNQAEMNLLWHEFKHNAKISVANCARQLGKSFWLLVLASEYALQNPGCQIKYAAQTAKQVRKILRPHMREIYKDCPDHLRPRYHSQDGEYRWPNGSTMTVAGCDRDNAETLRGQHADLCIVDEGGMVADLSYVVLDILLPQTLNTRGRIIISSTPAPTPGHSFKEFCQKAEDEGTYLERDIYCNPRISDAEIEEICKAVGGADSTTWKREFLCQHVTDEASAVVPEAEEMHMRSRVLKIDEENPLAYRPQHFATLVWIDPGWNPDYTGIVWAIWCFELAKIIIERDLIMRKMTTDVLAAALRVGCDELWGVGHVPYQVVSDVDGRLIADLALKGWLVQPTEKDNLDEAINKLRQSVSGRKFPVYFHPRAKATRRQFTNATWNRARNRFNRTELDGHYDLLAASIYGRRNLPEYHDPAPPGHGHPRNVIIIKDDSKKVPAIGKKLRSLFSR